MKIRQLTLGIANTMRLIVYIERVGKADLVAIPELEWCTVIPDDEGANSSAEFEALLERLRKSLERPLSYGDAEKLTDKIMEWITEGPDRPEHTMEKYMFPAVFEPGDKKGFVVTFPDLPGCITEGDTIEEAFAMAQEALELHLYGLEVEGGQIPLPSAPDITNKPVGSFVAVITVDVSDTEKSR